jgi:DNA uptake protein ComE-like DNA-binding protein
MCMYGQSHGQWHTLDELVVITQVGKKTVRLQIRGR